MRGFETMPETKFTTSLDGYLIPMRHSGDDAKFNPNGEKRTNPEVQVEKQSVAKMAAKAKDIFISQVTS